MQSFTDLLI